MNRVIKKTRDILKDTCHPLHKCYSIAKFGCRYLSERQDTNRYCNTFLPNFQREIGKRKVIGEGEYTTIINCYCKCYLKNEYRCVI